MTKDELKELRARLITDLADATSIGRREELQADLSIVNVKLKALHVEEAIQLKRAADEKRRSGLAENRANTERALAKLPAPKIDPNLRSSPKHLTRGEFLLKHAKQMLRTIKTLGKPMPHTVEFRAQLEAFIVLQQAHVTDYATAKPENWVDVWKSP